MALLDSEVVRIRYELGYHVLTVDSAAYIGYESLFDVVVQPFMSAGVTTTSSTSVTASDSPTLRTLTLASATGFSAGDRVVIDVDSVQEVATVRSISGSNIVVLLSLAHSGTYPVTVEAGETIVREILTSIRGVKTKLGESEGEGSLKKCDEIEFYQSGGTVFGNLGAQLSFWREELAAAIGIQSLWSKNRAAAQTLSVY